MTTSNDPARTMAFASGTSVPGWLWWSAAAVVATLAHTLIDVHIGLWGESSDDMSLMQAANLMTHGTVYGLWLLSMVFATHGDRWALRTVFLFAAVNAFFFHGLVAILAVPPPSAGFPYQDIAHASSLVTGGVAAILIRRQLSFSVPEGRRNLFIGSAVFVVLAQITSGLTMVLTQ